MNVVYAMTRRVYEWILPSLRSLAVHDPNTNVFILAEDDALPFALPVEAKIINVSGQTYFPKTGVNYNTDFGYINLLKVRYPSILPVDRVIHLDIDTIVCGSLQALWDTDLTGKWFGAVQEYRANYRPFGEKYYNMGVSVINLSQMREDRIEPVMEYYLNNVKQPWADQDAWNRYGLEAGKIVPLDVRWNESPVTGETDHPSVVHYASIWGWFEKPDMWRKDYLDKWRKPT